MNTHEQSNTLVIAREWQNQHSAHWLADVRSRNHSYVNPAFAPEHFPEIAGKTWMRAVLEFFPFNPRNGLPLFQLQEKNLSRPTYEHALCFAALYPNDPRSVLFFHEPIYLPYLANWDGLVTAIVKTEHCRYLSLPPASFDWEKEEGLWLAGVLEVT